MILKVRQVVLNNILFYYILLLQADVKILSVCSHPLCVRVFIRSVISPFLSLETSLMLGSLFPPPTPPFLSISSTTTTPRLRAASPPPAWMISAAARDVAAAHGPSVWESESDFKTCKANSLPPFGRCSLRLWSVTECRVSVLLTPHSPELITALNVKSLTPDPQSCILLLSILLKKKFTSFIPASNSILAPNSLLAFCLTHL